MTAYLGQHVPDDQRPAVSGKGFPETTVKELSACLEGFLLRSISLRLVALGCMAVGMSVLPKLENVLSQDWVSRIKLGTGVVGKMSSITAYACGFMVVPIVVLAYVHASPDQILIAVLAIPVLAALALLLCFIFAIIYPQIAVMEGADIVKWAQIKEASKEQGELPESGVLIDEARPLPELPAGVIEEESAQ